MAKRRQVDKRAEEVVKCDCGGPPVPRKSWKVAMLCLSCGRDSSWIISDPRDLGLKRHRGQPTKILVGA